jgi:pyroglutamyl-peptidase
MKNVLLTGFEPFGGQELNPSEEIARELHDATLARHKVVGALLPCVFGRALKELKRQIQLHEPALVVCVGQAGGRAEVTPERLAINLDDARIADNAGRQPIDRAIVKEGPAAYFSTLPVKAIVRELRRRRIPAAVSQTAGTFVCNHVFYGLMHALRTVHGVRGGFIHIPYAPAQAARHPGAPSLPPSVVSQALRLAVATALTVEHDVRLAAGTTH